jgi:hypothetical protein
MKIYSVDSVAVLKKSATPLELVIMATGRAATTGWKNPRLDAAADPAPGDAVLEFGFEADPPGGISLQVLTPISASVDVRPGGGADAVIISSRTNSITVHASEFIDGSGTSGLFTTLALGEEVPPTLPGAEGGMFPTTLRFGEEHWPTHFVGEQLPTILRGEHGPFTDPRVDDPMGPVVMPTSPFGEGPGPFNPWGGGDPWRGGGNPFGGF